MAKKPVWTITITVNGRTWTWERDTCEAAAELANKMATTGCTIAVGKGGGFDRVGPAQIGRIRVRPPRNRINVATVDAPGTMTIV